MQEGQICSRPLSLTAMCTEQMMLEATPKGTVNYTYQDSEHFVVVVIVVVVVVVHFYSNVLVQNKPNQEC